VDRELPHQRGCLVEMADKKWNIDLSAWKTMRDVHDFNKAQQSGDLEKVFVAYSDIIKAWEFSPDPSNPDAYFDLAPKQWKAVQGHVREAVTDFFQAENE